MRLYIKLQQALPQYDCIPITEDNYIIVREVFDTNPEYFQLFGEIADDQSILKSMHTVPEGFGFADKLFIAFCQDSETIAAIDLLVGYPDKDTVWLGLFLMHGNIRGKGVGTTIVNGIIHAAQSDGFDNIQLGVMEANTGAVRFWKKMGFVHMRTSGDILVFQRSINESL